MFNRHWLCHHMIQIVSILMFKGLKFLQKKERTMNHSPTYFHQPNTPGQPCENLRTPLLLNLGLWLTTCDLSHLVRWPGHFPVGFFGKTSVPFSEVTWKDEDDQNDGWILSLIDDCFGWRRHPVHEILLWYSNIPNTFFSKSTIALILMWLDLFSILQIDEVTRLMNSWTWSSSEGQIKSFPDWNSRFVAQNCGENPACRQDP